MNCVTDYDWLISYRAVTDSLFLSIDTDLQAFGGNGRGDSTEHTCVNVPPSCSTNTTDFDRRDFVEQTSECVLLQEIIKRDLFMRLSEEAKDVIHLVLSTPMELLTSLACPKGRKLYSYKKKDIPNLKLLARYLKQDPERGWKRKKVYSIFNEIRRFVESF